MNKVLEVSKLSKTFVKRNWLKPWRQPELTEAVKEVSFDIKEGEIVGLLGVNGAGKTTTTQMLLGALTPSGGEVKYFGKKFTGINDEVLKRVNSASSYIDLPHRMTVRENLDVYARLFEVKDRKGRIERLLKVFEVEELIDRKMNSLSAGQNTRVLMAKAMINYPKVLLLDEPTASLDPDIAQVVRKFLKKQQKEFGVSILFTSHNMKEVEEMCDRIVFLKKGEIVAEDTPRGLARRLKGVRVRLLIRDGGRLMQDYLEDKKYKWELDKGRYEIRLDEEAVAKLLVGVSERGVRYDEIEILQPTLEDYFLEVAKDE